jgi:hypothetical protein
MFVALAQKGREPFQIAPVRQNRVLGQALLDPQIAQEDVGGGIHHG